MAAWGDASRGKRASTALRTARQTAERTVIFPKNIFVTGDRKHGKRVSKPPCACKYYTARGHWQIYNSSGKAVARVGRVSGTAFTAWTPRSQAGRFTSSRSTTTPAVTRVPRIRFFAKHFYERVKEYFCATWSESPMVARGIERKRWRRRGGGGSDAVRNTEC
jgi:hypothetical protein